MRIRKKTTLVAALAAIGLLSLAGLAYADSKVRIRAGNMVIIADGGFSPKALPRTHDAPITMYGGGRLTTTNGTFPPILKTITILFDKHGSLQTKGLPVCPRRRLINTTAPQARRACRKSIVGKGGGMAKVVYPDQRPIPAKAPITIFNGPRKHGNATVFAHAYTTVPAPTTFIVPVEIKKIHKGRYGYRVDATIPPIAGGYGIPISGHLKIGHKWRYKGKKHSYVNARCADGRLQAQGEFGFKNGDRLKGTFLRPCKVRR